MRSGLLIGAGAAAALLGLVVARMARQTPAVRAVGEAELREFTGVYQWRADAFVYLQIWPEFSGFAAPGQLVAFDESGDVRVLYPTDRDRFFTSPAAADPSSIESRVEFRRDPAGALTSMAWQRDGQPVSIARRVEMERHDRVRFTSGDLHLGGTLITPIAGAKHPAIVLVHGSGPENREYVLPFARFLVRRGIALFTYDKRGVGESTGDWRTASFEVLAGDVVAAIEYLKSRGDIDPARIGLLGFSQAGWVMPLAAVRAKELAFLISVSGAAVPGTDTMVDQARSELAAAGLRPQMVEGIVALMKLQFEFARTGQGWDEYLAAREKLGAQRSPETFPGTRDHPYWHLLRASLYDPGPTLRELRLPILALFGERDGNIVAGKNRTAWEAALQAGGHSDYTLRILPRANHLQWESRTGTLAEIPSLRGFVPEYFTTITAWLAARVPGVSGKLPSRWP
jgi:pimeloyl-ACP methyl ester carboxylesterase